MCRTGFFNSILSWGLYSVPLFSSRNDHCVPPWFTSSFLFLFFFPFVCCLISWTVPWCLPWLLWPSRWPHGLSFISLKANSVLNLDCILSTSKPQPPVKEPVRLAPVPAWRKVKSGNVPVFTLTPLKTNTKTEHLWPYLHVVCNTDTSASCCLVMVFMIHKQMVDCWSCWRLIFMFNKSSFVQLCWYEICLCSSKVTVSFLLASNCPNSETYTTASAAEHSF